jgi:hypothetical protein
MRPLGPKRALPLSQREGPRPVAAVWLVLALAAAALGVRFGPPAAGAAARLARGELLQLQVIEVQGARRVPAAAIADAAGLRPGAPLVDLDVDLVERRVADLPAIASARALRRPPDRLVVGVVERAPAGVVETAGSGAPHLVCSQGMPFAPAVAEEAAGLPRLRIAAPVLPGEPQPALGSAAALAAELSAAGLAPEEVALAGPGDPEGAVVRLRGLPARVVLGEPPYAGAIARLVQLLSRRPDLAAASMGIDLRWRHRAVLRDKAGLGEEVDVDAEPRGGAEPDAKRRAG